MDFLERLLNEGIFICDSLFKLLLNEIVRRLCCLMFELIGVEVFLNIDLVLVFCEIVMVLLELLFFFLIVWVICGILLLEMIIG